MRKIWGLALALSATPFFALSAAAGSTDIVYIPSFAEDLNMPTIRFRIDTVGVAQALSHKNEAGTLPKIVPGAQDTLGNVHFLAPVSEEIDVYFELYLYSKYHIYVMAREGYVLFSGLPESLRFPGAESLFKYVTVKAGHFELDFGNQHLTRSDNAEVSRNPLIGNFVADPNAVEGGVEIISRFTPLYVLVGAGNGVSSEGGGGAFQRGRGFSKHAKLWIEPETKRYNVAASVYQVDHSATGLGLRAAGGPGTDSVLFSASRSGSRYSGVVEGSGEAGQPRMGLGKDVVAWQLDAGLQLAPLSFYGHLGNVKDSDLNGNIPGEPEEEWSYFGGEVKWDVTQRFWLASRYSGAAASVYGGQTMDGKVERLQLGLGYKVVKGVLFKTEYVSQNYSGFTAVPTVPGTTLTRADYRNDPSFSGVLGEISVSFGGKLFSDDNVE